MKRQVTPEEVGREIGWRDYQDSPMPFATVVASIDAGKLVEFYNNHKGTYRLNTIILHLLLQACEPVKETKLNIIDGKIFQFDKSCISCMMHDDDGKLRMCCIPYKEDLNEFQDEYNRLTQECRTSCKDMFFEDLMQIGSSNFGAYNVHVEAAIPAYLPAHNNPFFVFGKITDQENKKVLKIALSNNHILMDGEHVCAVLENFQNLINELK